MKSTTSIVSIITPEPIRFSINREYTSKLEYWPHVIPFGIATDTTMDIVVYINGYQISSDSQLLCYFNFQSTYTVKHPYQNHQPYLEYDPLVLRSVEQCKRKYKEWVTNEFLKDSEKHLARTEIKTVDS